MMKWDGLKKWYLKKGSESYIPENIQIKSNRLNYWDVCMCVGMCGYEGDVCNKRLYY